MRTCNDRGLLFFRKNPTTKSSKNDLNELYIIILVFTRKLDILFFIDKKLFKRHNSKMQKNKSALVINIDNVQRVVWSWFVDRHNFPGCFFLNSVANWGQQNKPVFEFVLSFDYFHLCIRSCEIKFDFKHILFPLILFLVFALRFWQALISKYDNFLFVVLVRNNNKRIKAEFQSFFCLM